MLPRICTHRSIPPNETYMRLNESCGPCSLPIQDSENSRRTLGIDCPGAVSRLSMWDSCSLTFVAASIPREPHKGSRL